MEPRKTFTQAQFQTAISKPLLPFLISRGYEMIEKSGEYRWKEHDSFVVSNNKWRWCSQNMGGNILSFLTRIEGMSTVEAVLYLAGDEGENQNNVFHPAIIQQYHPTKPVHGNFILPERNETNRHMLAYLIKTRGIDNAILYEQIKNGNLYESKNLYINTCTNITPDGELQYGNVMVLNSEAFQAMLDDGSIQEKQNLLDGITVGKNNRGKIKYATLAASVDELKNVGVIRQVQSLFNCVFIGRDEQGTPKFACTRSTSPNNNFRQDIRNSDKRYNHALSGFSNTLYVFEAVIDAYSHATLFKLSGLDWRADHRLSLSGLSHLALDHYLEMHPQIDNIGFCLDNDKAGHDNMFGVWNDQKKCWKVESLLKKYADKGYNVRPLFPFTKDYNEDLMNWRAHPKRAYFQKLENEEIEI